MTILPFLFNATSPEDIFRLYKAKLTAYELGEINDYKKIYFIGACEKKQSGSSLSFNFDAEDGSYVPTINDHIAYRYQIIKLKGKGTFGQVYKVYDHKTRMYVALKIMRRGLDRQANEEIEMLRNIGHMDMNNDFNVVRMLNSFTFRNHICITFELLSLSMYDIIKRNKFGGSSISFVRNITQDVLHCLKQLHRNKIIHGDIKPENILLKKRLKTEVKVIDFGNSYFEHQDLGSNFMIQSRYYRAPEVILGGEIGLAIDMWSLGCVLVEVLTGTVLLAGKDDKDQLAAIIEMFGMPSKSMLERARNSREFVSSSGQPRYFHEDVEEDDSSSGQPRYLLQEDVEEDESSSGQQKDGGPSGEKKRRGAPGSKTLGEALNGSQDFLLLDFLSRCLLWDPRDRMTPVQALGHPWLRKINRNGEDWEDFEKVEHKVKRSRRRA